MAAMGTYVALLRGINVGGKKKVGMADLRAVLEDLGYGDVRTLLQSGNAVFAAAKAEPERIERALADRFGFDVRVIMRTAAAMAKVVDANPFPEALDGDPKNLHVWFLDGAAPKALDVDPELYAPDRVAMGKAEVYVWHMNGMAQSAVSKHVNDKMLGRTVTARNWNTVRKLVELSSG